jgi:hypothetical protein
MARWPSVPPPSSDCIEAALALSRRITSVMVSKVGRPMMGRIVECGNPLMRNWRCYIGRAGGACIKGINNL